MTLGSLYIEAQGLVPVLLENLSGIPCLALDLFALGWCLVSVVGMEAFDELLSINVLWSHQFSGVVRIWT